jgi:hypothetical protein
METVERPHRNYNTLMHDLQLLDTGAIYMLEALNLKTKQGQEGITVGMAAMGLITTSRVSNETVSHRMLNNFLNILTVYKLKTSETSRN